MNDRLFKDLSRTLPILFSGPQRQCSFHSQILEPAVTLACIMQGSSTRYLWSLQKSILRKSRPLGKEALEHNKVVDMKTGKCLKPDNPMIAGQQELVGNVALMIEPGLSRVVGNGQEINLKQGTFVVNLNFPLGKRNRPTA